MALLAARPSALPELLRLSRRFGKDPWLAQAAGGNVSVKQDSERLLIKESGAALSEITPRAGWTVLLHSRLKARLLSAGWDRLSAAAKDRRHVAELSASAAVPGRRPSMEAGLHAAIPRRCVLHLHSAAAILLGMLPRPLARRLAAEKLGPEVGLRFLPAMAPGLPLALALARARPDPRPRTWLWILENHGAVWASDSPAVLEGSVERFESGFRPHFGLDRLSWPHSPGRRCGERTRAVPDAMRKCVGGRGVLCFCRWPAFSFEPKPLTPDYAVYTSGRPVERDGRRLILPGENLSEVVFLQAALSTAGAALGILRPLPAALAAETAGLEAERLRLSRPGAP